MRERKRRHDDAHRPLQGKGKRHKLRCEMPFARMETGREYAARLAKETETCECGDYRRDHVDGTGACKLNGLGHMVPGYSCHKFRLAPHPDGGSDA